MSNAFEHSAIDVFVEVLDALKIPYAIGGSVASSVYGHVRFTQDADISVTAFPSQIKSFCQAFENTFYVSPQAVKQAHQNGSSFNAIHFETAFKIDVFVVLDDPFKRQLLQRRRTVSFEENPDKAYDFVSPEDIVLLKLQWYREGGDISEKQWSDIVGVLETQRGQLDVEYMRGWALKLSVSDLLNKAIQETMD